MSGATFQYIPLPLQNPDAPHIFSPSHPFEQKSDINTNRKKAQISSTKK